MSMDIYIKFTLDRDLIPPSVWAFDRGKVFIKAGEEAAVTKIYAADPVNPLYQITNASGESLAIHREYLVKCGYNWGG